MSSLIWRVGLFEKRDGGGWCIECKKIIKICNRSPQNLIHHVKQHSEFEKIFKKLQEKEKQLPSIKEFVQIISSGIFALATNSFLYQTYRGSIRKSLIISHPRIFR